MPKLLTRFIPILILLIVLGLFFYFQLYQYLSFSMLQAHRAWLTDMTEKHYSLAVILYCLTYIIAVAVSIPGATLLTLMSGFLFGIVFGTIYVVISATIGACILFMAAKTAFGELLANKAGPFVKKMEQGIQQNAFSYILFLRFVPLFPFWLINIVPAILNVRFVSFAIATLIGIIPGTFVYVLVGNGLSDVLTKGGTPNMRIIFQPSVLIPLIALGILSLIPVVYKKLSKRKSLKETHEHPKD